MLESTRELARTLESLTVLARASGLNDSAWAAAAGFSKETADEAIDLASLAMCICHAAFVLVSRVAI